MRSLTVDCMPLDELAGALAEANDAVVVGRSKLHVMDMFERLHRAAPQLLRVSAQFGRLCNADMSRSPVVGVWPHRTIRGMTFGTVMMTRGVTVYDLFGWDDFEMCWRGDARLLVELIR